ncbi:MAG: hypothetical protein PHC88_14770 [Terrimicrobiaceae bacterium]|nr:hypothetical protein [Terrimicrobiaceae bacterium]
MRSNILLALGVASALFAIPSAHAKKTPPDFTPFRGTFTGVATLATSGGAFPGPVTISIQVPKNGRSAMVTVSGSITATGTTLPFSGNISLAHGTFTVSEILFNALGNLGSATGTYTLKKNSVSLFSQLTVTGTPVTITAAIRTSTAGRKQKVSISYVLTAPGVTYAYSFEVSRKVKKKS